VRGRPQLLIALVIALFGLVRYFSSSSTNEVTGEVQRVAITPDQEIALGLQSAPQMFKQFGGEVDPNHPVSRYVEAVGQRVVQQTGARNTPYKFDFHVLQDPETINAFALPGGPVSITVGLLRRINSEAELAGVLGHEIGHVVGRHGAEHLAKQQLSQTLVGAGVIAAYDPSNPRGTATNAAVAAAISQLVNMRYGRQDELQSDSLGVVFIKQAGYDPRGMLGLMQVLASSGGGRQPEFFSTHPNPENRLQRIQALIQQSGGAGGETGEDRFQANVKRYVQTGK
jgi:predicted Zn-dependent protease